MSDLLSVDGLVKSYPVRTGMLRRVTASTTVLDDVSLQVGPREVLGLAGESGSGKTTLARCLVGLVRPEQGSITFEGDEVVGAQGARLRSLRRRVQVVYQDPYSSLNPRLRVAAAIGEAARVHGLVSGRAAEQARVIELLEAVGLRAADGRRYPRELSGGQRQRVAIARALATGPRFLIADEAVSALDVSVQAQIINLLAGLSRTRDLSMIFISHQLAVLAQIADRIAIMYHGRVVEVGPTEQIFTAPRHPYTQMLLSAHPTITGDRPLEVPSATSSRAGDERADPDPAAPGATGHILPGCPFAPRCGYALPGCRSDRPGPTAIGAAHIVCCHVRPDPGPVRLDEPIRVPR